MPQATDFTPNWASAPGDTISDLLTERSIPLAEFARSIGYTAEGISELLEGRATITLGTARQLERVLGASVEFWMTRDFQYRQTVSRLYAEGQQWLTELPASDMINFGWINPVPHPSVEVASFLRFFDVPNVVAWREQYGRIVQSVAFRTSTSFDAKPGAVAAWLRQGEIEAGAIECLPWDPERFRAALPEIRALSRDKDPQQFVPELQRLCAGCGVAVVTVRNPTGSRASGATRFLSTEKAMLLLSFRHLSDDHFWFTFFHEAAHLLLHGLSGFFVEGMGEFASAEEHEANELAATLLIPNMFKEELLTLKPNAQDVVRFARRVGVSPGIVVGQLQHLGKLRYNQLNSLKRRYRWSE